MSKWIYSNIRAWFHSDFLSSPGLAWEAALEKKNEIITVNWHWHDTNDGKIYQGWNVILFIDMAKAASEYMKDYNKNVLSYLLGWE